MGADSRPRRLAKRLLGGVLSDERYAYLLSATKAWDIRRGTWSEPELKVAQEALREGDVAVDVGANLGLYTYHLSLAVGPSGRVIAFEPVPVTAGAFRQVIRLLRLKNVTVLEQGCSNMNGTVTFSVPMTTTGTLSVGLAHMGNRANGPAEDENQVLWSKAQDIQADVVRLDDALAETADIAFMKLDIEGAEPFALAGAHDVLRKHLPTLVVEVNSVFLSGFDVHVNDVVVPLENLGYDCYRYVEHVNRLVPERPGPDAEGNFVFLHPARRDRLARLLAWESSTP